MQKLFDDVYAPATLGILLREFTHGHARQLGTVLRQHLVALTERTGLLEGIDEQAFVDTDSLLRAVFGHAKQGASFGHTKIAGKQVLRRGLSPMVTIIWHPGRRAVGRRNPVTRGPCSVRKRCRIDTDRSDQHRESR